MRQPFLVDLPKPLRLAAGLFAALILAFYAAAQVNLILAVGGGAWPGPDAVLANYHGTRKGSRLHSALDPARLDSDPKAMYPNLGKTESERAERRARILRWVESGAPESAWPAVASIFAAADGCAQCHSRADGGTRVKADLPLETYEDVKPLTAVDTGMTSAALALSTHNHVMGFALSALVVSVLFAFTRWPRRVALALMTLAFVGPAVDVASWWLTHQFGHPFEYGVLLGGALYGFALVTMALLSLDELWLGSRLRRFAGRVLRRDFSCDGAEESRS